MHTNRTSKEQNAVKSYIEGRVRRIRSMYGRRQGKNVAIKKQQQCVGGGCGGHVVPVFFVC